MSFPTTFFFLSKKTHPQFKKNRHPKKVHFCPLWKPRKTLEGLVFRPLFEATRDVTGDETWETRLVQRSGTNTSSVSCARQSSRARATRCTSTFSGWWFGCHQFFIFPEILGCIHHPNWRTHFFQRGGSTMLNHQPVLVRQWVLPQKPLDVSRFFSDQSGIKRVSLKENKSQAKLGWTWECNSEHQEFIYLSIYLSIYI